MGGSLDALPPPLCAAAAAGLVLAAGVAAGLTIGLLGMSNLELELKRAAGDARAVAIWPIKKQHHRLLVTLVVANAIANEALPLFLDAFLPSTVALISSVTLVLFFGEIFPSALFTGSRQLTLAARLLPVVRVLMWITAPVSVPIAMLLDRWMGVEGIQTRFQRAQLRNLVSLHAQQRDDTFQARAHRIRLGDASCAEEVPTSITSLLHAPSASDWGAVANHTPRDGRGIDHPTQTALLDPDEAGIIKQVLHLHRKAASSVMTPIERVRMLPFETRLDEGTLAEIISYGHSRLPVFRGGRRENIVGLLLVKNLIVVDPAEARPLSSLPYRAPLAVKPDLGLFMLLNRFQVGRGGHVAIVCDAPDAMEAAWAAGADMPNTVHVYGIVTLEDVIEALLGEEVFDETDFKGHMLLSIFPSDTEKSEEERLYATVVRCAYHWRAKARERNARRLAQALPSSALRESSATTPLLGAEDV